MRVGLTLVWPLPLQEGGSGHDAHGEDRPGRDPGGDSVCEPRGVAWDQSSLGLLEDSSPAHANPGLLACRWTGSVRCVAAAQQTSAAVVHTERGEGVLVEAEVATRSPRATAPPQPPGVASTHRAPSVQGGWDAARGRLVGQAPARAQPLSCPFSVCPIALQKRTLRARRSEWLSVRGGTSADTGVGTRRAARPSGVVGNARRCVVHVVGSQSTRKARRSGGGAGSLVPPAPLCLRLSAGDKGVQLKLGGTVTPDRGLRQRSWAESSTQDDKSQASCP